MTRIHGWQLAKLLDGRRVRGRSATIRSMSSERPFFSSDAFLDAFREWYFPDARTSYVSCEGVTARGLVRRGRAIGGLWDIRTSFEPEMAPEGEAVTPVAFLPDVIRETTCIDGAPVPGLRPAPFIRWPDFASWDEYRAFAEGRNAGASFRSLAKRERELTAALGPVRFALADSDEALFDHIFEWKTEQLAIRNEQNRFAVPKNREFFKELQRRGLLFGASLRAGDTLVAGQIWGLAAGRRTGFLPAYLPSAGEFSPGAIGHLYLFRHSFEAGDQEFDFMQGAQPYKLAYATHIRWLGNLGREPAIDRARRVTRMKAGELLRRAPALQRRVRQSEAAVVKLSRRATRR
jgi:hypothetical protein